jgi:dTMP kinase
MNPRFIVLEGPDGAGTTTHAELLAQRLVNQGKDVMLTNEPTKGPIGLFIREQLSKGGMSPMALQLLFSADRAWHVQHEIEPALVAGKTVISDRYWLSTVIYANALGIDADPLLQLNRNFVQPDVLLVLLPPFDIGMSRIQLRNAKDMLEEDSLQRRVYEGYRDFAESAQIPIIDTSDSVELTAELIASKIS